MTERKWTPGPWVRDCWDILGDAQRHGGGTGAVCEAAYPSGTDDKYWSSGEAGANAHLIAAASDLYEALEEVLDGLGFLSGGDHELEGLGISEERGAEIRATLAKARGKTQ